MTTVTEHGSGGQVWEENSANEHRNPPFTFCTDISVNAHRVGLNGSPASVALVPCSSQPCQLIKASVGPTKCVWYPSCSAVVVAGVQ